MDIEIIYILRGGKSRDGWGEAVRRSHGRLMHFSRAHRLFVELGKRGFTARVRTAIIRNIIQRCGQQAVSHKPTKGKLQRPKTSGNTA